MTIHSYWTDIEDTFAAGAASRDAEIEALKATLQKVYQQQAGDLDDASDALEFAAKERDDLKAKIEALRKDALRYRWLKEEDGDPESAIVIAKWADHDWLPWADDLDAAIDAAITKELKE
jgi:hypothetical protein